MRIIAETKYNEERETYKQTDKDSEREKETINNDNI